MNDLIITNRVKVKDLIKALNEEFNQEDMVSAGFWIRIRKIYDSK
jgi:hypothetical protein